MNTLVLPVESHIENIYRSDDVTFRFQPFEYHVWMAHDEILPHSKFSGNQFQGGPRYGRMNT